MEIHAQHNERMSSMFAFWRLLNWRRLLGDVNVDRFAKKVRIANLVDSLRIVNVLSIRKKSIKKALN